MKTAVAALAVLCLANAALAITMPLTAESLNTVLDDMFDSIDADFSPSVTNSVGHKRSLLQSSASGSATGTGSAASSAASALGSVGSTLSGLFNHNWASEFSPDALKNLNWTQLGTWQNTTPLQDVIDNHDISLPDFSEVLIWVSDTTADIEEQIQNLTSSYCTPAACKESSKKPASCTGPSVSLVLVPHTCVQEDSWDAMSSSSYPTTTSSYGSSSYSPPAQPKAAPVCTPAQLLLVKTPGKCSLKHNTPATYTGKSCIFQKTFGFNKTEVYGGDVVTVPINHGIVGAQAPLSSAIASAAASAVGGNGTGNSTASGK